MNESVSIAVTVLGIFLELLAILGLSRLMDVEIPKRTILVCTAAGIGIITLTVVIFIAASVWGVEPFLVGCLLLGLVPGTTLAAYGILALTRWLNWRDNPGRHSSRHESSRNV